MSTLNFRQFSKPEVLQQVDKKHLIDFFKPFATYFRDRGLDVLAELGRSEPAYASICNILITSDDATPDELAEALYYVNDVASEDGAEVILDHLSREPDLFIAEQDSTPADLALQLWMARPKLLKRISGNLLSVSKRSYDYFQTSRETIPVFQEPSEEVIAELENALDDWFYRKLKGRFSKVICTPKEDYVWFTWSGTGNATPERPSSMAEIPRAITSARKSMTLKTCFGVIPTYSPASTLKNALEWPLGSTVEFVTGIGG